jgi:hypothetical protein
MKKLYIITMLFWGCYSANAQNTAWPTTTGTSGVGIGTQAPTPGSKLDIQGGGINIGSSNLNALDATIHVKTSFGGWDRLTQMAPSVASKPGLNLTGYTNPDASVSWWSWGAQTTGTWAIQPDWRFGGEAGLFVDRNGNMGVGVSAPLFKQHIKLDNEFIGIQRGSSTQAAAHYFVTGTGSAITYNFLAGLRENSNDYHIYNGQTATDAITVKSTNNFVGIGTDKPDAMLAVKGTIHTQEVRVDIGPAAWPDYVFKQTYQLRSLTSVKAYIDKNHHLPDMPSEAEVAKEGVNLGEMNKLLLKKVEELTLYLIEINDKLQRQASINENLLRRITQSSIDQSTANSH